MSNEATESSEYNQVLESQGQVLVLQMYLCKLNFSLLCILWTRFIVDSFFSEQRLTSNDKITACHVQHWSGLCLRETNTNTRTNTNANTKTNTNAGKLIPSAPVLSCKQWWPECRNVEPLCSAPPSDLHVNSPPAIQPVPNKPKTMPLPWTQIS